jgi:hypothetical protein
LRERVNLALYHRWTAKKLVKALNDMPEVKAVLAEHFGGRPVSTQNIYEWKWNGYRDWLHRRQILENKRELAADARDLADTAPEMADSLFGILTLDYAHLMMNRDGDDEAFEKKRKTLSTLSQDIVRLYRCRLNARRIQVQETKLENETEKTEEQLHFKFREWTQNPDVRKALILAPMEADRQMRILHDLPAAPEDPLVERKTRNDPYFGRSGENKTRTKPDKTKNSDRSGTGVTPVSGNRAAAEHNQSIMSEKPDQSNKDPGHPVAVPSPLPSDGRGEGQGEVRVPVEEVPSTPSEPTPSIHSSINSPIQQSNPYAGKFTHEIIADAEDNYAGEKARRLNRWRQKETGEMPIPLSGSDQKPQPAKPETSPYEKALLEGKTFIEALYAQFTPVPKPKDERPKSRLPDSPAWEPVHYAPPLAGGHRGILL